MTRAEIILMADASGISLYGMGLDREKFIHHLEAFAKLVAQKEREACIDIVAMFGGSIEIEAAIRARGQA